MVIRILKNTWNNKNNSYNKFLFNKINIMKKYKIIIKADCWDADYITEVTDFWEDKLELYHMIQKTLLWIKDSDNIVKTIWDKLPKEYKENLEKSIDKEDLDIFKESIEENDFEFLEDFQEILPFSDNLGIEIHTIESVEICEIK